MEDGKRSHRINVWHIYLHLVDLNGKMYANIPVPLILWGFCSTSKLINFSDQSWCHGEAGGLFACWLSIRPLLGQDQAGCLWKCGIVVFSKLLSLSIYIYVYMYTHISYTSNYQGITMAVLVAWSNYAKKNLVELGGCHPGTLANLQEDITSSH